MRSALLLTLGTCAVTFAVRQLPHAWPQGVRWLAGAIATLLGFGGGAYLGLCKLDGDHRKLAPMRRLSRAQLLWLALLGVLAVCPVSLARDLAGALAGSTPASAGIQTGESAAFTAAFVKSALLAPVCEELFFRGYLLGALKRAGTLRAAIVVSLCFALVHALSLGNLAGYTLLGLLLCWMTLHTQSLLAPVVMHAAYNAALLVLDGMGLSGLFMGWSLLSCAVRLAGCGVFMAVLRRAYTARAAGGALVLWEGERLSRREIALLVASALLLAATLIMGG